MQWNLGSEPYKKKPDLESEEFVKTHMLQSNLESAENRKGTPHIPHRASTFLTIALYTIVFRWTQEQSSLLSSAVLAVSMNALNLLQHSPDGPFAPLQVYGLHASNAFWFLDPLHSKPVCLIQLMPTRSPRNQWSSPLLIELYCTLILS